MNSAYNSQIFRKTWMFPRNIRKIHPWKLSQICRLLSLQIEEGWSGNQKVQDRFCLLLEDTKLKRKGHQYCLNSGGPRTYLSQLKCLGLIFERSDRSIWFTRAGQQLMGNKESPLKIIQNLILRIQYPSPYSMSKMVNIDPAIRIKPFVFVLRLMSSQYGLNYLSKSELMIPVIYGHNLGCFEKCKKKIERMRGGENLRDLIDSPDDLWTQRGKDRDVEKALKDIGDIANTVKNYLQSARLIFERREAGSTIYEIDPDYEELIMRELTNHDFIQRPEQEEQFQRQLGCLDRTKDTRTLIRKESTRDKITTIKEIISASFLDYCGENLFDNVPLNFINTMIERYGVKIADVIEAVEPFMEQNLTLFEEKFISLSKGEGCPKKFEDSVSSIFKQKLYFESYNTSNRRRPVGVGGYGDVLVVDLTGNNCAIIDAKASPKYILTSDDYIKMKENYILNYEELPEAYGKKLEFCLYVAGGFHPKSIENKLNEFSREVSVPVSAISARNLLRLCSTITSKNQQIFIRSLFCRKKLVELDDIMG